MQTTLQTQSFVRSALSSAAAGGCRCPPRSARVTASLGACAAQQWRRPAKTRGGRRLLPAACPAEAACRQQRGARARHFGWAARVVVGGSAGSSDPHAPGCGCSSTPLYPDTLSPLHSKNKVWIPLTRTRPHTTAKHSTFPKAPTHPQRDVLLPLHPAGESPRRWRLVPCLAHGFQQPLHHHQPVARCFLGTFEQ